MADLGDANHLTDLVYDAVRNGFGPQTVTPASVLVLMTLAMRAVERMGTSTGPEKKAIVLHVVRRLLEEIPEQQSDRAMIIAAAEVMLPAAIDTVIAAARGKLLPWVQKRCCQLL